MHITLRSKLFRFLRRHQVWDALGILVFVGAAIYMASLVFTSAVQSREQDTPFAGRDFARSPFALLDAHTACLYTAKKSHKDRLLRAYMDDHSTHFDPTSQMYNVVIIADIGSRRDYKTSYIYCRVSPFERELTYYKETANEEGGEKLQRAFDFFSRG